MEILNNLFALLSAQPVLSIVLGAVLTAFLAWVFQDVIKQYIKKKYNLYDEQEIVQALNVTNSTITHEDIGEPFNQRVINNLTHVE